jgi:hypothetical protein
MCKFTVKASLMTVHCSYESPSEEPVDNAELQEGYKLERDFRRCTSRKDSAVKYACVSNGDMPYITDN